MRPRQFASMGSRGVRDRQVHTVERGKAVTEDASEGAHPIVLIVDDDVVVAHIYELALTRKGFRVLVAHDGQAGLEAVRRERPSFVFLDIRMPKMDGIAVLRSLNADATTRMIPVVMLSNYDESDLIRSSVELGAKQYLVKVNTDPGDLAAIVTRWLEVAA